MILYYCIFVRLGETEIMTKKRKFTCWMAAFLCFCFAQLSAQNASLTDSLINVLKTAKADTNQVNILNELGQQFGAVGDNKLALIYENKALALAEKIDFRKGAANILRNLGNIFINQGNYTEALKNINASLTIYKETGDKKGIASSYGNIGSICFFQGNYPDALKNYFFSLKLKEEIGDKKGIANTINNIANIYTKQGNFKDALEQYFASLKIREEIGDKKGIATCYNNIGTIYDNQGDFPDALKYFQASLKIKQELRDKTGIASSYNNIGILYSHEGNYPKAMENYMAAVKIYEESDNKKGIVNAYVDIGRVLSKQASALRGNEARQKYAESHKILNEGLLLAKELGDKDGIKEYYRCLSETDSLQADFASALANYKSYSGYKDSLLNEETNRQVAQMKIGYETEKKDKEMNMLELRSKQQMTLIVASITIAMILIIVVLLIINSRRKLKKTYLLVHQQKDELESIVDKLKKTQYQLIQSEKMASLGMLTAGIAHEINNPVNFINSGAISLQRDYEDLQRFYESIDKISPESQMIAKEIGLDDLLKIIPQTIEDIKTGVTRTSEIIGGLRNFTRMDASELKEADLHEGLRSALLLLSHKYKDRIRIVKDYDDNIGSIKCYPGPLNQVFMNLLNNAIDAIDQKIQRDSSIGTIAGDQYKIMVKTKLILDGEKKQVAIVISDNGIGIPEMYRDNIFDPFFTTKEVGKGTGLGLFICHGIIDKHGGIITYKSIAGEGSEFTITIPVS